MGADVVVVTVSALGVVVERDVLSNDIFLLNMDSWSFSMGFGGQKCLSLIRFQHIFILGQWKWKWK